MVSCADRASLEANSLLPFLSSSLPASSCLSGLEIRSGLIDGPQEASSAEAGRHGRGAGAGGGEGGGMRES